MSNYPEDIRYYDSDPRSPYYSGPDGTEPCDKCGYKTSPSDLNITEGYLAVCDECLSKYFETCEDCSAIEYREDCHYMQHDDIYLCDKCWNEQRQKCPDCGEYLDVNGSQCVDNIWYCIKCVVKNKAISARNAMSKGD